MCEFQVRTRMGRSSSLIWGPPNKSPPMMNSIDAVLSGATTASLRCLCTSTWLLSSRHDFEQTLGVHAFGLGWSCALAQLVASLLSWQTIQAMCGGKPTPWCFEFRTTWQQIDTKCKLRMLILKKASAMMTLASFKKIRYGIDNVPAKWNKLTWPWANTKSSTSIVRNC